MVVDISASVLSTSKCFLTQISRLGDPIPTLPEPDKVP